MHVSVSGNHHCAYIRFRLTGKLDSSIFSSIAESRFSNCDSAIGDVAPFSFAGFKKRVEGREGRFCFGEVERSSVAFDLCERAPEADENVIIELT